MREGGSVGKQLERRKLLTSHTSTLSLPNRSQVAEQISSVESLSRATEAHEDEGLVGVRGEHVSISLLAHGTNVRRHVFTATATEHIYHLKRE